MQVSLPINVEKYDWQTIAIKKIQKEVLGEQHNSFNMTSFHKRDSKLVVVYGPPQIGKTTLILFLLGIDSNLKYKQSSKNIYEILRGSSSYGNSSTSTAILYEQSKDENFYIEGELAADAGKVIKLIDNIRLAVEKNTFKKDIIHIAIPKDAFRDELRENFSNIRYLDMPGVDSKNLAEIAHVDSIYKQYLTLATTILIVCNKIQSLATIAETSRKKLSPHWELLNRYIIITVKSFSESSIVQDYFDKPHKKNMFYDYIKNKYKTLIQNPELLPECKSNIYSFDLGSSVESLKNTVSSEDLQEIKETNNLMAEDLRAEIQSHKGNAFSGIVKELKVIIEEEIAKDISFIDAEICMCERQISNKEKENEVRDSFQEIKVNSKIAEVEKRIQILNYYLNNNDLAIIREFFVDYREDEFNRKIDDLIGNNKTGLKEYFSHNILHSEKKMAAELLKVWGIIQNFIKGRICIKANNIKDDIDECLDWNSVNIEFNKIRFPDIDISDFSKKTRNEYLSNFEDKIKKYELKCLKSVQEAFYKAIKLELEGKKGAVGQFKHNKSTLENNSETTKKKIKDLNKKLSSLKNEKKILEKKKEENINYLDSYKKVGEEIYQKCRKQIISEINKTTDKDKKLILALYWGTKETEYRKFLEEL